MNERKNNSIVVFLTLIFPFAGLIYTLSHWRESWAKNTFWLACIYLGAVLVYCPEGTVLGEGGDGGRYVLKLIEMYGSNITLTQIIGGYLTDGKTMDLYQPIMTYLVSCFTNNGHVLFAVFALVFGFFYSRNIWYVLERLPEKKLGGLFILVTLYFLICPITQINGVRMWTALHVFVYGMMPYLMEKDGSKLWCVLLTPLIHFSFLYVVVFAVIWVLLPYRFKTQSSVFLTIALVFFTVTMFVKTLDLGAVGYSLVVYSPEEYEKRIEDYTNEDYALGREEARAQNNWYVAASGNVTYWNYNILLLTMLPCLKRNFKQNKDLMHLYVFALLFGGFANILALIPSGGRFQLLSQMFQVPLIMLVAMRIPTSDKFRKLVSISQFFLLLPFIFEIRKIFDYYSITLLFGNFITVFFWENNVPIMDFIKRLV